MKPTLDDHTDFFRVSEETAKLEQTTVWSATSSDRAFVELKERKEGM